MGVRGQLFATDFLIAMAIIILGFGTMAAALEFNMYQNKGTTNYNILTEKAETAAITLANATWADCNFGNTHAAYTINTDKINSLSSEAIKSKLGLTDYNANISISLISSTISPLTDSMLNFKNISTIDLNILACNNTTRFVDLNACMTGSPSCAAAPGINKATIHVMVGE